MTTVSEVLARVEPVLAVYADVFPLQVVETADYAKIHAARDLTSALALTVQPSLIMLLNEVPALVSALRHAAELAETPNTGGENAV